jgi:hypothetical protein
MTCTSSVEQAYAAQPSVTNSTGTNATTGGSLTHERGDRSGTQGR